MRMCCVCRPGYTLWARDDILCETPYGDLTRVCAHLTTRENTQEYIRIPAVVFVEGVETVESEIVVVRQLFFQFATTIFLLLITGFRVDIFRKRGI